MGFHGCVLQPQIGNAKYAQVGVKLRHCHSSGMMNHGLPSYSHMDEFGAMTA